jgi:hypothetical protein
VLYQVSYGHHCKRAENNTPNSTTVAMSWSG